MPKSPYKNLKQLGHETPIPPSPDSALIEKVPRPFPQHDYLVRFTCSEFTCLCPVTGQPDFAHIVIDYVPGKWLVESKSLKLYFQSFRNFGIFHEPCTVGIGDRLIETIAPKWLRISGYWYPRGGMPIDVFFKKGKLPEGVDVPDTGVTPYRGRG
jgi:7-cyano-7-deazaguanine reductase